MATLSVYGAAFAEGLRPDREWRVWEWADRYRMLSGVSSAVQGQWRTEVTPYLRGIMDELSPQSKVTRVVFDKGAQVGGTECGNNFLAYVIACAPGPMLYVQPTVEVAKRVSKQRIAPMLEASPALRGRVQEPRSRDSGNTVQMKEFPGGVLIVTGANSAAGLRSMPVRYLFLDEVDEYPGDVEGQGDPIALAERRTSTFRFTKKVLLVSTPTMRGTSRIEREYLASDQRRYFIPCPFCGTFDFLLFTDGGWRGDQGTHHFLEFDPRDPETTAMRCSGCKALVPEFHKTQMLARGEWRATAEGDGRTAGFHLSALYSPLGWVSWSDCVAEFLSAKSDPFRLKAWVNTILGETWEEKGEGIEASTLVGRLEEYAAEVPVGVGALVAAADVQDNRIEVVVNGYGDGEECWTVAFEVLHGDPSGDEIWHKLDEVLLREFTHASGRKLPIECAVIDSGGHHTERVYKFASTRVERRVFAIKGGTDRGKPLVGRPTFTNKYRVPLYVLCVDTGKEIVTGRLRVPSPSPGYLHLPGALLDEEYLSQLTAEKSVRKYFKGRGWAREWVKTRERNEALDLNVYALAALYILGPVFVRDLGERARQLAIPVDAQVMPAPTPSLPARRPGGGWVTGWRN